jgi:hypothetical protein
MPLKMLIDSLASEFENDDMSIDVVTVDPDVLADVEAVIAAVTAGQELDAAVVRRIRARTEEVRERILREHGPLDIAVPAIRELRDR